MKLKKIIIGSPIVLLPSAIIASCTSNQFSSVELRKQYHQNNVEYNNKIKEFGNKLNQLKTNYQKAKTDDEKTKIENSIFDLYFQSHQILKPLVQRYNYLFKLLRDAEKRENSTLKTIKIFHSNDEHGRLEFNDGKFSRYAGLVETSKYLQDKQRDLLISAGDLIQGLPLSDSDKGKTMAEVAKFMGYDSIAVGNHEFDYGLDWILQLNKQVSQENHGVKTPFISANIYYRDYSNSQEKPQNYEQSKVGKRVFQPYIIKELSNGIKVAIFALTTPDTVFTSHPRNSQLVEFRDPVSEAEKVIAEIRQQHPNVNFIISSVHLGIGRNNVKWTSEYLARNVKSDLNLIIDGHSHTYVEINKSAAPEKDIYLTQTEAYTKYLGDLDVTFDTRSGKIVEVHQVLRNIDQIEIYNSDYPSKLVARLKKSFSKENSVVAFSTPQAFEHVSVKEIENTPYAIGRVVATGLGALTANSLAWGFQKEKAWESHSGYEAATIDNSIGLMNGGGLRANLKQGNITREEVLAISPFGNRIVTVRLKGDVLKQALVYGLSRGRSGGFAQLSTNVSYDVKVEKGLSEKSEKDQFIWKPIVDSIKINNKAIDENKYYYLTTNDFITAGGDGYKMLDLNAKDAKIELAYEGEKYIDVLINFAKLISDPSKNSSLKSENFEHKIEDFAKGDIFKNQKVEIPRAAETQTLGEPSNKGA
ncbi:bifunctional metallophosphatase/5'-nucleotidase [Mesomycoplasma conjunctivae]|uniref:bifunctional metallophosphatase/5'-nucleotidase n=1 Tax=Mesomycoplasma conjunctivae TaxID=45361 RepID=UPI003DA475C5